MSTLFALDWFKGNLDPKPWFLPLNMGVSCKYSLTNPMIFSFPSHSGEVGSHQADDFQSGMACQTLRPPKTRGGQRTLRALISDRFFVSPPVKSVNQKKDDT